MFELSVAPTDVRPDQSSNTWSSNGVASTTGAGGADGTD